VDANGIHLHGFVLFASDLPGLILHKPLLGQDFGSFRPRNVYTNIIENGSYWALIV
jgi:hypothetical protein